LAAAPLADELGTLLRSDLRHSTIESLYQRASGIDDYAVLLHVDEASPSGWLAHRVVEVDRVL
jgi:hypothetical protein